MQLKSEVRNQKKFLNSNFGFMLYVYTGDGKGKTTAALGLIMRAYGSGKSCAIIFFDKNSDYCNELSTLKELGIPSYIFGINRVFEENFRLENNEDDFKEVNKALDAAYELAHGNIEILVLDEFLNAIRTNLLPLGEAMAFLDAWPANRCLVLTGRGLPDEIQTRADLVSEIQAIKHPFAAGAAAVRGIDY